MAPSEDFNAPFRKPRKLGYTIVELLVTITIVLALLGLFLPAVQSVRESGRRTQCQDNVKQIALGTLVFHETHQTFPYGGWGQAWVGVPERGSGLAQPGGWIYNVLPYIEERSLHDLGIGLTGLHAMEAYSQRLQTPIPVFVCVTRRSCASWPVPVHFSWVRAPKPYGNVALVARADYAINAGTSHIYTVLGPVDLKQGDDSQYWWKQAPNPIGFSGISHLRTATSISSIIDGTTNTYLLGEKYIDAANYETGNSPGDNESLYSGYSTDLHRFAGAVENISLSLQPYVVPLRDVTGPDNNISASVRFGSAHDAGLNMAFCDGSVHFVQFDIDGDVHFRFGHRRDRGRPIALRH